ncbi:tail fiber domain-containing protein, partial [Roseivirga echinicomitans]|uniref:tail fiber domain-containing protein n=1 Tax=Roseivirga echinicomitans TaxID=296218 RepID=UPI000ABBA042
DKGDKGDKGDQGIAGTNGAAGTNGLNGSNGADGADGKTILNGSSNPASSDGVDGDFFINTTTLDLFGPKTAGNWGSSTSLIGDNRQINDTDNNTVITTDLNNSNDDIIRFKTAGNEVLRINNETLEFTSDSKSVFIGEDSGLSNTGDDNVGVGIGALEDNTSGSKNVALGYQSLNKVTTGSGNVMLGYRAGFSNTGSNKLYIENSPSNSPLIYGDFDKDIINFNGKVSIGLANPSSLSHELYVNGSVIANWYSFTSDVRFKKSVLPIEDALSSLLKLEGKTYDWRTSEFPDKKFSDTRQIGFIAQEVQKIFPELVTEDSQGYLSLNYAQLTPVLVEAVKEQQSQIEQLNDEVEGLKDQLSQILSLLKKGDKHDD